MLFNFRDLNVLKCPFHQYWLIFWNAQTIISAVGNVFSELCWCIHLRSHYWYLSCHTIVHETRKDCVTSRDFVTTKNEWHEGFLNDKDSLLYADVLRIATSRTPLSAWRDELKNVCEGSSDKDCMSTLNCFKDREAKAFALKSTKFSFKITQKGKTKNQLQKMKTGTRPHVLLKQPFALASEMFTGAR